MANLGNLAIVRWIDISSHDGAWMDYSDAENLKPISVDTVGWIIKETNEYIVIVSSLSPEDGETVTGSVNAIPRGCIQSIYGVEPQK